MSVPLTKVDSAIAGLSIDEKPIEKDAKQDKKGHKRTSSTVEGVWNIKDLGEYLFTLQPHHTNLKLEEKKIEITLPIETQKTGW